MTKQYTLYVLPATEVTVTVTLQQFDSNNYFNVGGSATNTGMIVQPSSNEGSVVGFSLMTEYEYCSALVEVSYPPTTLNPSGSSYGHIYFKPDGSASGGAQWYWEIDSNVPGDNLSIFVADEHPHHSTNIKLQVPTQANPNVAPTNLPSLEKSVVFLLDQNANGNLLFRGNEPLAPSTGSQQIDFEALHNVLAEQYQRQTKNAFPYAPGTYVLRDIAFLGPDEMSILRAELSSFGGNSVKVDLADQAWYPKSGPAQCPFPKPGKSFLYAQMANWNVLPSGVVPPAQPTSVDKNLDLDVQFVKQLKKWMNETGPKELPTVYYIHCSSGHDRTGVASAGYLMAQYPAMSLSKAFIMGTTINRLSSSSSGNLVQVCNDLPLTPTPAPKPPGATTDVDPHRSRCFVAGSTYNNTIIDICNVLRSESQTTLSADAVSGDPAVGNTGPAYVYRVYPWES